MIICVEGADGCGKTSVAEAVAKALNCEVIAFPNDAARTGPMIRSYLKRGWHIRVHGEAEVSTASVDMGAMAFQALQVANRMELMPRLDAVKHSEDRNLVLARYWQSGWVYGQLDGLPADWLRALHLSMVQPDVNVLLDVPAEECMRRRAARDGALPPERYEGKLEFTRKVVALYRELWDSESPGDGWRVVDATQMLPDVVDDVLRACQ